MWRIKRMMAVVLVALCLSGCGAEQNEASLPAVPNVETTNYILATAKEGTFRKREKNIGNPVFASLEYITCEYEDAILKNALPVTLNKQVKKGDVLATVVQETLDTDLTRLELEYERAVESMENGIARHYSQIAAISGSDSVAYMRRVQAENSLALYKMSAEKACQTALEALEEYRQRYEEKNLLAPCDGKVYWTQTLNPGDSVPMGSTVVQLYDPAAFYIRVANPSEAFMRMAAPGTQVTVTFLNRSYAGTVISTPNGLRDVDGSGIYIASDEILEWPEVGSMTVEFTALELENMLMLDKTAIRTDDTADYVMVLENNEVQKRYVICGPENDEVVCILDGLAAGQQVVLN